ncbi:MAG TPA: hypothetical protein VN864_01110 [Thermoplasmata archaeon]|nr:hypothetical protein [Thermoplasmata archaeon]
MPQDFDGSDIGQATARAGMDPRQWGSIGVVENPLGGDNPVDFSNGYPLVTVRLHPSDNPVRCRVAAASAGVGEGEWIPFQAGDEVIVAVTEGDERAGPIIHGRLNNGVDTFPGVVAGLDVTQNNVHAKRTVPNFVWELENGWMILNDPTQAQLSMDASGNWAMMSGEGDYLRIDANGVHVVSESNGFAVQIGGGAQSLIMDPSSGTILLSNGKGPVMIAAAGAQATDHVLTIEGFCNLMTAWGLVLAGAVPVFGVGAMIAATLSPALMPAWVLAAAGLPLSPTVLAAIAGGLAVPRVPGVKPGIGAAGVLV